MESSDYSVYSLMTLSEGLVISLRPLEREEKQ